MGIGVGARHGRPRTEPAPARPPPRPRLHRRLLRPQRWPSGATRPTSFAAPLPRPAGGRIPDHARTGRPLLRALPRRVPRPRQRTGRAPRAQSEGPHRDAAGPLGRGHEERPGHARRDSSERPRRRPPDRAEDASSPPRSPASSSGSAPTGARKTRSPPPTLNAASPSPGREQGRGRALLHAGIEPRHDPGARGSPGQPAGGAGFLAVDVSRDREVASLAAAFEIRDAPALLVVSRDSASQSRSAATPTARRSRRRPRTRADEQRSGAPVRP